MKYRLLSSNMLKVIAAVTMFIDHMGLLLFPDVVVLRIIGRIAFPIFAYMIAEGARYTKNKLKYFSIMFFPAAICQIIYGFIEPESLYFCILITFSLSVLVIYAMQFFKKAIEDRNAGKIVLGFILFSGSILLVWWLNCMFEIDYGFWGSMAPVWASVFMPYGRKGEGIWRRTDFHILHVLMLGIGLIMICMDGGFSVQIYSVWALPLLALYSGERGKWKMKYFFYVFYPVHLALLGGIFLICN